jgi:hypothetical protein
MPGSQLDALTPIGALQASDLIPVQRGSGNLRCATVAGTWGNGGTVYVAASGDTTGATDAAAIQAAITSGLNVLLGPGVFYLPAGGNLLMETYASCGQTVQGCGSYYEPSSTDFGATPPANATVIRPVSGFTGFVFVVDGTPIGGAGETWVQGCSIQNLCVDLQSVPDVSTNGAINQVQAWDCLYLRVRVINDGSNKRDGCSAPAPTSPPSSTAKATGWISRGRRQPTA